MRRAERLAIGLAVATASLVAPSLATAGVAHIEYGTLFYVADPGEKNDVLITTSGNEFIVDDRGPSAWARPGVGCRSISRKLVACTATDVTSAIVQVGDRNDRVQADVTPQVVLEGGTGNDTLIGGTANDFLYGGDGSDSLNGRDGTDDLDGGAGTDVLEGGPGFGDVADYQYKTAAITVRIDPATGIATGGEIGENDTIMSDVESFWGGAGADTFIGDARGNIFRGLGGDDYFDGGLGGDLFNGGSGFDTLDYSLRTSPIYAYPGLFSCQSGEFGESDCISGDLERVIGGSGDDYMSSYGTTPTTFEGRAGNDTLFAGDLGGATLLGGSGNDALNSRNGSADTLDGGDGTDTATVDSFDAVTNCETVNL
jgi:Ca2+-binding RTX toxin-like protein